MKDEVRRPPTLTGTSSRRGRRWNGCRPKPHFKRISELQSLKANPLDVSMDTLELLEVTKSNHVKSDDFATLQEMMGLWV